MWSCCRRTHPVARHAGFVGDNKMLRGCRWKSSGHGSPSVRPSTRGPRSVASAVLMHRTCAVRPGQAHQAARSGGRDPAVAQANLDVDGRGLSVFRSRASPVREVIDRPQARLRHRLERTAEHWEALRGNTRGTAPGARAAGGTSPSPRTAPVNSPVPGRRSP